MNAENEPKQIDKQPELSKIEISAKLPIGDQEESLFRDLITEAKADRKQAQTKISEIKESLDLEHESEYKQIKQHLREYLELNESDIERITLLKVMDLQKSDKAQLEAFDDKRLVHIVIAVVPDDLWIKGSQPSESNAENKLILIKQSYFEAQENPDEIAWLCHELAHCQIFLDSESKEEYQNKKQKFAFDDIKTERAYPNNQVEQLAFTHQFEFLKEHGKSREDVLAMLGEYYHEDDFVFFNKLLDSVYGK